MSSGPIVIVGAGPAGLSCAESYREAGGEEPVTLIGDDPDAPYERPPLTKEYLRGELERDALPIHPQGYYRERAIELRTSTRIAEIDLGGGIVAAEDGQEWQFGALVLATGSAPLVPDMPGVEDPSVRTIRRIGDAERLRAAVGPSNRVLVVGSGFIGCEAAISLAGRGADVVLATNEERPQQARLGEQVATRITGWIERAGVSLHTGIELQRIEAGAPPAAIFGGQRIEADLIVLALGVRRNSELARRVGIELDGDAIGTDERMGTELDRILAVGDVARARNPSAGRRLTVEHWGEALNHGRVAGAALAGDRDACWDGVPGFWSSLGEHILKQAAWGDGFDRVEVTDHEGGGFTARYGRDGELVGILTHDADADYERGRELVEGRSAWH